MRAVVTGVISVLMVVPLSTATPANAEPVGAITTFAEVSGSSAPYSIALGADGAMWFTQQTTGEIGRITVDGTVTEWLTGLHG